MEDLKVISDIKLNISTATNRWAKVWKNSEILWSDFLKKLSTPVVTKETALEYKSMKKDLRDNIKDVGGFVGGFLKDNKRRKENLVSRSLITLDLDNINVSTSDIWDTITLLYDCELCVYSTHSHTEEKPRLRLIIPTDKLISAEEYQAISRRIADDIGIDMFDDTTYEPERLMYWASHPTDVECVFKVQHGKLLDTEKIKDTYLDWKDTSMYPTSSRQQKIINKLMKKQEDPLEKKGVVGAFCRAYSISECIDAFLFDYYVASDKQNRYTYLKGSTANGLVVYDDKFAYSHHGTDPSSGILCNAFDLVRLHLYKSLDEDVEDEKTSITKLPSYKKMMEFATEDKNVKKQFAKDKAEELESEFEFENEEKENWLEGLDYNKKGEIENTIQNCLTILSNDEKLKGKLIYDEFSNRATVKDSVPWTKRKAHDWSDTDDSGLRYYLEKNYNITGNNKIEDAKNITFDRAKYHPVRDYLSSLTWDGKERIPTLFIDYLGADDNIYTKEVARIHLVAAVARIFNPGVKYDSVPTFTGKQGIGKSTFISKLAKGWFSDGLDSMKGKEAAENIQGVWHIELGELNATRKSDIEIVKAFLSRQYDVYRVAYAKNTSRFPRQCVFWGTTNSVAFLRDVTGERRHYPISCDEKNAIKSIWKDLTEDEVDQLWAEAVERYRNKESIILQNEALDIAEAMQEEHKEESPLKGLIVEYLSMLYPENWADMSLNERIDFLRDECDTFSDDNYGKLTLKKDRVCVLEIWCELLGKKPGDIKPINSREISDILRSLRAWEPIKSTARFGKIYGTQKGFKRI